MVLLDEADVFLEKRLLHDLDRNALVSGMACHTKSKKLLLIHVVFLRVLEYYDGMLSDLFARVQMKLNPFDRYSDLDE